jgi:cell wall-associated NlpC family hydrolase
MDQVIRVDDLVGIPFLHGGRDLSIGVDCFGLLMECHRRLGQTIPDYRSPAFYHEIEAALHEQKQTWISHWERAGRDHVPLTVATPGRSLLIAVRGQACHVGFVYKPGWFVHTWEETQGVTTERLSLWKQRILGVYEFDGRDD